MSVGVAEPDDIVEAWRDAYFDHRLLGEQQDRVSSEGDALLGNEARGQRTTREIEVRRVEAFYDDAVEDALRRYEILKRQLQELRLHKQNYETCYNRMPWPLRVALLAWAGLKLSMIPATRLAQEKPHSPLVPAPYTYSPSRYPLARHWLEVRCYELWTLFTSIEAFSRHNVEILKLAEPPLSFKQDFVTGRHVIDARKGFLEMYADNFADGNPARAEKSLSDAMARPDPKASKRVITVLLAVYILAITLTACGLHQASLRENHQHMPDHDDVLQIFGALYLAATLGFAFALNMLILHRARVNTALVFQYNRKSRLRPHQYFYIPSVLYLSLSLVFCGTFTTQVGRNNGLRMAAAWTFCALAYIINPLPVMQPHSRWWLVCTSCRVVTSGLIQVEQRDFWIGDELCSLSFTIYNLRYLACLMSHLRNADKGDICTTNSWTTAIFAVLPFVFRFGQSCRRLYNEPSRTLQAVNAVKYALSIAYQLFYYGWRIHGSPSNKRKVGFVIFAVVNSLVSFAWDVGVDWSLLQPNRKNYLLREKLGLFNRPEIYYASAIADLPLRFAWCVYLITSRTKLAGFGNASLEIIRRAIWNTIRVESEDVGNRDDYRTSRQVPLPYDLSADDGPQPSKRSSSQNASTSELANLMNADAVASTSSSSGRRHDDQRGRGDGQHRRKSGREKGLNNDRDTRGGRPRVRKAADYTPATEVLAPQAVINEAARVAVERAEAQAAAAAAAAAAASTSVLQANGDNTVTSTVQADDAEPELCYICTEPVKYYVLGLCSHRTCHICALRLRALYKKRECTFCKMDLPTVVCTNDDRTLYQDFPPDAFSCSDAKLGIAFMSEEAMEDTLALLRFNCPYFDCDYMGSGWLDLKKHARTEHDKLFCDLCTRNKKIFTHEHTLFAQHDLTRHVKEGDACTIAGETESTGFTGHPACEFCRITFYDSDQLFAHCRDRHEQCFLCIRNGTGRYQYYVDYPHLETHFQSEHFLCLNPRCLEQRFVVFNSEIDLQAHQLSEHNAVVGKTARRIETHFTYAPSHDPRAGGAVQMRPRQAQTVLATPDTPTAPPTLDTAATARSASSVSANAVMGSRGRTVPGLQRGGFDTRLSSSVPSSSTSKTPRDVPNMEETITGVKRSDPSMAARHASLLSRVSQAVGGSEVKISGYRSIIRTFRKGEMSASDAVKSLHDLLERQPETTAQIIASTADLLESYEKRNDLNNAWQSYQSESLSSTDAFPSLVPTEPLAYGHSVRIAGPSAISSSIRSSSSSRSLAGKTSSQGNSAIWARVEQAAANKNVGAVPGLTARVTAAKYPNGKEKYPALPTSMHAVSTQQPRGATPWASSRTAVTAPGSTYFPVASSASSSIAPSPARTPAFNKATPKAPAIEFPSLPLASSTLQARNAQKAVIFGRSSPLSTPAQWSAVSPPVEEIEEAFRQLEAREAHSSVDPVRGVSNQPTPGKKKKGKQLLLHVGL